MRKTYFIPTTEIANFALTAVLCASAGAPDLGKSGNTGDLGGTTINGD